MYKHIFNPCILIRELENQQVLILAFVDPQACKQIIGSLNFMKTLDYSRVSIFRLYIHSISVVACTNVLSRIIINIYERNIMPSGDISLHFKGCQTVYLPYQLIARYDN